MDIILAILTIISLTITGSIGEQDDCPERDPSLTCERSCTPETGCRKAGRQCECAGDCGWSCIRQGCPVLSAPENGSVTIHPDNRTIGSTATYTCNDGLTLQGTSVRTCQEDKTWSGGEDEVSCECTRNDDEINRLGRVCARACPSDGICLRTGHTCICDGICGKSCIPLEQENYCDPALLSTNHATYTVDPPTAEFGSIAQYTCVDGFSPSGGDSVRTCAGGGGWDGSALVCRPDPGNACYDPPVVENGSHNGSKEYYLEGELLVYTCDYGYYRDGSLPPMLRCQQTGDTLDWGNFDTTCLPIPESQQCSMPQDPSDGRWVRGSGCVAGQNQFPRCELSYTCSDGYEPANPGVVNVCLGPAWDLGEEPLCEKQVVPLNSCDKTKLPLTVNLLVVDDDENQRYMPHSGYLLVRCEGNHRLLNGPWIFCKNGKWTGSPLCGGN